MLKRYSFFLFPVFLFNWGYTLYGQKTVTVSGSAQIEVSEDKSIREIKDRAKQMATIDALERAFGRVVIQGNSTYISNVQTGEKVETNTVFNTIANTSVKGEVVEVLDEKYSNVEGVTIIDGKKTPVTEMRCDIEIKAREMVTPPVEFLSYPLACTRENCKTTSFKNEDDLYMFFSTPSSGYLSIFLDDKSDTYCLFPYSSMPSEFEGGVPVVADKKYILFTRDPAFNYFPGVNYQADEYQLSSNSSQEMNRLFVIFSKLPLNKPFLEGVKDIANGYKLPRQLKSEDFQRWLNKYRSLDKSKAQVSIIDITITKK